MSQQCYMQLLNIPHQLLLDTLALIRDVEDTYLAKTNVIILEHWHQE